MNPCLKKKSTCFHLRCLKWFTNIMAHPPCQITPLEYHFIYFPVEQPLLFEMRSGGGEASTAQAPRAAPQTWYQRRTSQYLGEEPAEPCCSSEPAVRVLEVSTYGLEATCTKGMAQRRPEPFVDLRTLPGLRGKQFNAILIHRGVLMV